MSADKTAPFHESPAYLQSVAFLMRAESNANKEGNKTADLTTAESFQGMPEHLKPKAQKLSVELFSKDVDATIVTPLKNAIVEHYKRYGVENITPENVRARPSTDSILASIFSSDLFKEESKQKILLPTPTFGLYIPTIQNSKYNLKVTYSTKKGDDYKLNIEQLRKDVESKKPGALLIMNPVNPTGQVYTDQELKGIVEICAENDILLIADEIFIDALPPIKGKEENSSMAYFIEKHNKSNDKKVHGIVTGGISKSFGGAGARLSYAVGDEELLQQAGLDSKVKMTGYNALSASLATAILDPSTLGANAVKGMKEYRSANRDRFNKNLKTMEEWLTTINENLSKLYGEDKNYIKLRKPEATSVALLDFSELKGKNFLDVDLNALDNQENPGYSSKDTGLGIAKALREACQFILVPGEASMIPAEDMICRIAFSNEENLNKGFDSINTKVIEQIKKERSRPRSTLSNTTSPEMTPRNQPLSPRDEGTTYNLNEKGASPSGIAA